MSRLVLLVLPVVLAYAATAKWIWDRWLQAESYYSHGPLVPLIAAAVVWLRRADWRQRPVGTSLRGWWLLGPGLFLHLCGAALTIDSVSAASLLLTVPGLLLLVVGAERLRPLLPVVGLLLFALPPPIFVTGKAAFELKEIAVESAVWLCNAFGLAAQRSAAQIVIPGQATGLDVAPACSGLRSLVALTTLGYCVAFFMGSQRGVRRWLVVLAAVPIAVLSNIVRITGICLLASWQGVAFASGTGHDILNVVEWIAALSMLLAVDALCSRRRRAGHG